jgi:signal transduction histidine kinase
MPSVAPTSDVLLQALTEVSLTGIIIFRPVYAPDATTIVDLAYVSLNPTAQRLLSLPECPAASFLTLYPNAVPTGIFAFYRDTFLADAPGRYDVNYQHDRLDNYFQLAARRAGEVLVVSFSDTADQPRSTVEEALRQAQASERAALAEAEVQRQRLLHLFTQAPALIAIMRGPDHVFELANAGYQAVFGSRQLVGHAYREVAPELAGQGFVDLLDTVYRTGETYYATEAPVWVNEEGRLVLHYYNFIYQATHDAAGQCDGILNFAYDVTEQVRARQQVQTLNEELNAINEELRASNEEYLATNTTLSITQQQLRELNAELEVHVLERTWQLEVQQAELQRLFQQAPMAIVVLRGPKFIIEQANEHAEAIWGRTAAEVMGRPHFEAIPDSAGQGFEEMLTDVLRSGEALVLHEVPIVLMRPQTGRPDRGYYSIIFKPLRDGQSHISRIAVMWSEVTDQVLARQQVQALNEELTATNQALYASNANLARTNADLDNFIYTASHDLKAPISNIEGLLNLLPELLPEAVRQDELVQPVLLRMQESAERFKRTIGHLTDVSKLQVEFAQPARPVRLATVIEEVRQDLLLPFTEAGAQLDVAVDSTEPRVFSEKNLRSLIYNLLSNALKYRHPGRVPHIRVACVPQGTSLVLTVQDNGLGLSEQQQQRVFQLFQRLHTHVEGTGVGLYMVKKILEHVGGTVALQSQEGVGTTFTLTFPA